MLSSLLLAATLLLQDPQPAPKTVEDRLKELETRLATLEKKHRDLSTENAALEKRDADRKETVERITRSLAKNWVDLFAKPAGFTETQSAEIEELWYAWARENLKTSTTPEEWKKREGILRGKLTPDQSPRLTAQVRDGQAKNTAKMVRHITQSFKLPAERTAEWEKGVIATVTFDADMLIPEAHLEKGTVFTRALEAVEAGLQSLPLTPEEQEAARKGLEQFKPRPR
jgi:hypothetical protein